MDAVTGGRGELKNRERKENKVVIELKININLEHFHREAREET